MCIQIQGFIGYVGCVSIKLFRKLEVLDTILKQQISRMILNEIFPNFIYDSRTRFACNVYDLMVSFTQNISQTEVTRLCSVVVVHFGMFSRSV